MSHSMTVLFRKVLKLYWDEENDVYHQSIKSITHDWGSEDKNWSMFKVDFDEGIKRNSETDSIVLRLVGENPKKCVGGVDLLVIDENLYKPFVDSKNYIEDKLPLYHSLHVNLLNVTFRDLSDAINYALSNQDNIIPYSPPQIKYLFIQLRGDNKLKEYVEFVKNYNKNGWRNTFSYICKNYILDDEDFFRPYY